MTSTSHRGSRLAVAACLLAVVLTACGGGSGGSPGRSASPTSGPPYAVSTRVVSDATTRDIQVWAPTATGHWPVVYALPGISGHKSDFDLLAPALARHGVVVFVSDYNPVGTTDELIRDVVCGYRYARRIAPDYGGDLTRPVTGVGYSEGARFISALVVPDFGPTGSYSACFTGAPPPTVLVGINGCYYSYQNKKIDFSTDLGTKDVDLVLVTGTRDDVCVTSQSQKAADALRSAGYRTTLVSIPGANHYTPVYHDVVHGTWTALPTEPAGDATVRAVLDAIRAGG